MEAALIVALPPFATVRPRLKVKALLIKTDRLGDLTLIAPLVQTLMTRVGPEQIALVVSEANVILARLLFPSIHIVVVPIYLPPSRPRDWIRSIREVASIEADDAFLLLHFLHPPHLKACMRALRAKRIHWLRSAENIYAPKLIDRLLLPGKGLHFKGPPPDTQGGALDSHLTNFLFSSAYGEPLPRSTIRQPALPTSLPQSLEGRVLLFPFASSHLRTLPAELVAGIVGHLSTVHRRKVTICAEHDRVAEANKLREKVLAALPQLAADALEIWVPASFEQFYHSILAAPFIVSTDSAPAHFAIIHDKPMIGLLGGGHFGRFAPWSLSAKQRWVWHPLPCYGCNWECKFERAHCVTDIPVPAIQSAIDNILALG